MNTVLLCKKALRCSCTTSHELALLPKLPNVILQVFKEIIKTYFTSNSETHLTIEKYMKRVSDKGFKSPKKR